MGEEVAADLLAQDVIPAGEALSRLSSAWPRMRSFAISSLWLSRAPPASTLSQSLAMVISSCCKRGQYTRQGEGVSECRARQVIPVILSSGQGAG